MRNNRASKAQAVALIRRAVREGFTRTVDTSGAFRPGERPFAVTVHLTAEAGHPATKRIVQIFVTFYRRQQFLRGPARTSIAVTTNHWFTGCDVNSADGLWDANYQISRLAEDRDDHARRQAQGPMLKEAAL